MLTILGNRLDLLPKFERGPNRGWRFAWLLTASEADTLYWCLRGWVIAMRVVVFGWPKKSEAYRLWGSESIWARYRAK